MTEPGRGLGPSHFCLLGHSFIYKQSMEWSSPQSFQRLSQLPHSRSLFLLNPSSLSLNRCHTWAKMCLLLSLSPAQMLSHNKSPSLFNPVLASVSQRTSTDIPTYPILHFQGLLKSSYHIYCPVFCHVLTRTVSGHLTNKLEMSFCTTKECRLESLFRLKIPPPLRFEQNLIWFNQLPNIQHA